MRSENKISRKALCMGLSAALLLGSLTFAGCGETDEPLNTSSAYEAAVAEAKALPTHGAPAKKYQETNYTQIGGLTITDNEVGDFNRNNYGTYISISGLKDKELETDINRRIREKFFELYERDTIPPYRGAAILQKEWEGMRPSVSATAYGSAINNVLSVSIAKSMWYNDRARGRYLTVSDIEVMNIDLATGEEITLKDMFVDDFNYVAYINDKVRKYITENNADSEEHDWYEYSAVTLAGKFESIPANPKFTIDAYSNTIQLCIDYNYPEFDTRNQYTFISIDLGKHGAMRQRFDYEGAAEEIYENPVDSRILMSVSGDGKTESSDRENYDIGKETGIEQNNVWTYYEISTLLPEAARDRINDFKKGEADFIADVKSKGIQAAGRIGADNLSLSAWMSAYSGAGTGYIYVSFMKGIYIYDTTDGFWSVVYDSTESEYCYFDPATGKEIDTWDFFAPDADVEQIMYDIWKKEAYELKDIYVRGQWYYGDAESDDRIVSDILDNFDELSAKVYPLIRAFSANSTSLALRYDEQPHSNTVFLELYCDMMGYRPNDESYLETYPTYDEPEGEAAEDENADGEEAVQEPADTRPVCPYENWIVYNIMQEIFNSAYFYSDIGYDNLTIFK